MGRFAIAVARPRTQHVKNTRVICCTPRTLYGALSQLFLIHSFFTLLTALFLTSLVKLLYSTFVYFSSFKQLISVVHAALPVKYIYAQLKAQCVRRFTSVSFFCVCNKGYRRCYDFVYQFAVANLFKTLTRDLTLLKKFKLILIFI